ncbi:PKD domain protein [uncultured archaeon]|nr:PKD domain protein [uncultured archaeon]
MVKVLIKGVVFLVLSIFFISMISATFTIGNTSSSIPISYSPGQNISGWINISLNAQSANSTLTSSLGDSINLMNLIKKTSNSGFLYTCNPATCTSDYLATNDETTKTFDLGENESVMFVFKLTGELISDVSSFIFNVSSNNPETEKFPLSIDLLNDGKSEWQTYSSSHNFGTENFGCFVGVSTSQSLVASTPMYCEKINIQKTPEVTIGAYLNYIKGSTSGITFNMRIQKVGSSDYKTCPATATGTGIQRIACSPANFKVLEPADYFVCISTASSQNNGNYGIASEQVHPCGFTGNYAGTYNYDFEIFAQQAKYAAGINFTFNDAELSRDGSYLKGINNYVKGYLSTAYNNNCTNGCVIPIKIYSGVAQQVKISDVLVSYTADTYTETPYIYNTQETSAIISSSNFQKLYLDDAGFKLPTTYGNYTFSLSLGDNNVLSQKIFVEKVPTISSLSPISTAIKYPTTFVASASSENNITKYDWNFGDGTTQSTTTDEVTHTYTEIKLYIINLTITDSAGKKASRVFDIDVGSAATIVPTLLQKEQSNLANIKSQMISFSEFEQKSVNNSLGIKSVEQSLVRINDSVLEATATGDETSFGTILGQLLRINIPESISQTASSTGIIFYPTPENINLEILKKISGGDYSSASENLYKDAILAWNNANVDTEMEYNEISGIYPNDEKPIVKTFDVHLTKLGSDDAYVILGNMSNLLFGGDYSPKEIDGYYYIDLTNSQQDIIFSTTDNVDFVNLPMFISPALSQLSIIEATPIEENTSRWGAFAIIVGIILAGAIVIWMLLSMWYKRRYETFLFKDRNNLYNLVNYIGTSKKSGLSEKEISEKLKKSGWNVEQINYALKKYSGKNTGLPQIIPMGKIFKRFKKNPVNANLPKKI